MKRAAVYQVYSRCHFGNLIITTITLLPLTSSSGASAPCPPCARPRRTWAEARAGAASSARRHLGPRPRPPGLAGCPHGAGTSDRPCRPGPRRPACGGPGACGAPRRPRCAGSRCGSPGCPPAGARASGAGPPTCPALPRPPRSPAALGHPPGRDGRTRGRKGPPCSAQPPGCRPRASGCPGPRSHWGPGPGRGSEPVS